MNRIRKRLYSSRAARYNRLGERARELQIALAGIDYEMHPFDYNQIEDDLRRTRNRAQALLQKLRKENDVVRT